MPIQRPKRRERRDSRSHEFRKHTPATGHLHVQWRPPHKVDGFECRIEGFGADGADFQRRYEETRGWSPFNYEVTTRINRGHKLGDEYSLSRVRVNATGTLRQFMTSVDGDLK